MSILKIEMFDTHTKKKERYNTFIPRFARPIRVVREPSPLKWFQTTEKSLKYNIISVTWCQQCSYEFSKTKAK